MMGSAETSDPGISVQFDRKALFSAHQNLILTRGHRLVLPNTTVSQTDPWKIKPPDFSPKLYRSQGSPLTKKKNLKPDKLKDSLMEKAQRFDRMSPVMLSRPEQKRNEPTFITSYKPPGLLELKLLFVKSGTFPSLPFKDPKPHNFRPSAEAMPNMATCIKRDPGNLSFKTQFLESITEIRPEPIHPRGEPTKKMDTFKPAEPKWDPTLILPKSPWPPKSASYTRHRRRRGVHTAFMDRVGEKLSRSWVEQ